MGPFTDPSSVERDETRDDRRCLIVVGRTGLLESRPECRMSGWTDELVSEPVRKETDKGKDSKSPIRTFLFTSVYVEEEGLPPSRTSSS